MSYLSELGRRLRTAGIEPDDADDVKLKKSLLMFAMGLTVAAPVLWLTLYGAMGLNLPASVPFGYQLVSLGTLLVYLVTRNFDLFRVRVVGAKDCRNTRLGVKKLVYRVAAFVKGCAYDPVLAGH